MRDSPGLPRTTPSACRDVETVAAPKTGFFAAIRAEFRRALAAMQRYEDLRYGRAGGDPGDIPRRIFEEFYAGTAMTDGDGETGLSHRPAGAATGSAAETRCTAPARAPEGRGTARRI